MIKALLTKPEKELLGLSKNKNIDDILSWKISNVWFPIAVIVLTLFAYLLLIPVEKKTFIDFFNLLLNGSILMVALNRMSSFISYYPKIQFGNERPININLGNLKMKILFYVVILVVAIIILYSYQVIYKPFPFSWFSAFILFSSIILLWFSVDVTKVTFLLQESLLNNTFESNFKKDQELIIQIPPENEIKF
jgi:hypothetical protein